jgi:hypothetical protein
LPAIRLSRASIVWWTLPNRPSWSIEASRSVYSPGLSAIVVVSSRRDGPRSVAGDIVMKRVVST